MSVDENDLQYRRWQRVDLMIICQLNFIAHACICLDRVARNVHLGQCLDTVLTIATGSGWVDSVAIAAALRLLVFMCCGAALTGLGSQEVGLTALGDVGAAGSLVEVLLWHHKLENLMCKTLKLQQQLHGH